MPRPSEDPPKTAKQLLIYESAVPVTVADHGSLSLDTASNHTLSADINAVPLMAVELPHAAAEYAIVFTATEDDVIRAAVLGMRNEQYLFLDRNQQWQSKYIPAFIRRYPFVFAASSDGQRLTLCIDETHPVVNRDGRRMRLFGDEGKPTEFTDQVLKFLSDYQTQFERTRLIGRPLKELNLLEPMQADINTPTGEKLTLSQFHAVSRKILHSFAPEKPASLATTDELELIYRHLYSTQNFDDLKDKLLSSMATSEETGAAASR